MITISNETKTACNSENITYKEYIVIDSTTVEIKGKMSNTAYKDGNFIGTFNLKMLEFTTENDIDYRKKEFVYYKEVNDEAFKIGTYIVTGIKESDTKEEISVTAMDYGLKFAIPYVSVLNYEGGLVTLKDVLDEICSNTGVTLNNGLITNGGFIVDSNQFVSGELCGDVVASIAGMTGDFATINQDDELELIFNTSTSEVIEDYVELDDKRDTRPITIVVLGNKNITGQEAVRTWAEGVALYGENYLRINDNLFAYTLEKREALIDAIYNKVKGFGYSSFESKYSFKPYMQLGDLVQFKNKNGNLVNSIILRIETDYDNIILSAPSIIDASVDYELTQTAYDIAKRAEIIVNKATGDITLLTEKVEDNDTYISNIQLTPEEIRLSVSKVDELDEDINNPTTGLFKKYGDLSIDVNQLRSEIGDVTDITTQEEGSGTLEFESINTSEPINITIRPTSAKDISYLYPSSRLFPSSNLFPQNRILRFYNSTEDETIDYILPGNLRYYDADNYDEFFLDFATTTCKIIRKVAIAEDMTKSALAVPVEETFTYPNIPLSAGNYTVTMLGYPNAYMKIRLMSQNMYTSQFATRVELSSAITQSANEINLEVAKKTDKTAIISTINQTAEAIKIQASKIDITGTLTAINNDTSTTINGNKITTGSITTSQVSSSIITTSNLSAQNINATQITAGTLSTARLNSDVITTTNFSAQNINADKITAGTLNGTNVNITNLNASNITGGTISADKIDGGTISGSSINLGSGKFTVNTSGVMSATSGTIAGLTISSTELSNANAALRSNGTMLLYPQVGSGGYYAFNNGTRINVTAGVGIASNSNGSVALSGGNLDVKACSGSTAYLACMINSNGTGERSAVECANGTMYLRSTGAIYANGVAIGGSSSKATKKNIKTLSQEKKDELYELIKNIEIKEYDYKKMYGKKNNYGFIIEDIEKTKLNDLLHITQHPINQKIKTYSSEDLTRLCLITIQELMKKIEKLEDKND